MEFTSPIPFTQAITRLAEKAIFPTDLSSAQIRDMDRGLRDRSLFSARTTAAGYLQSTRDRLAKLLQGETNTASMRAEAQDELERLGYDPAKGFRGEEGVVPPAERGSLRDLSSDARLDLMLSTNVRQVANFALREIGTTPAALWQFPAWELIRLYPRTIERGERLGKGGEIVPDPGEDWPSRWEKAGGTFYDGRMIARKDDPVWESLGDSDLFDDALDTATPPFAFNSGMGWKQVDRAECIALGVIDPADEVTPEMLSLNEQLKAGADIDPDLLRALRAELDVKISGGEMRLANRRTDTFAHALLQAMEEVLPA